MYITSVAEIIVIIVIIVIKRMFRSIILTDHNGASFWVGSYVLSRNYATATSLSIRLTMYHLPVIY